MIEKSTLAFLAAMALTIACTLSYGQEPGAPPVIKPHGPMPSQSVLPSSPLTFLGGDTFEQSIKVDPKINLSLCVAQGVVKVNGWSRNELRVYVENGSRFAFKVLEKSSKTGDPVWLMISGIDGKSKYAAPSECISGAQIEIDVPTGASVNIKGQETTTTVDSVRKVSIRTIGGDISLRNIAEGVMASSGQGDVTVEGSEGAMTLESTTGNILVFEAGPSEIGDALKAKTNSGTISLQKVGHRQIEVNSISGSVAYSGEVLTGGSYTLGTSRGSIRLAIPAAASCRISATYGYGRFTTEIPVNIETENIFEGPIKTVVGSLGKGGDASLKLTTNNGSINIKKQ